MENYHRKKLSSEMRPFLIRNLQLTDQFLEILKQKKIITETHIEKIKSQKNDPVGYFLDLITKRGPNTYDSFLDALDGSSQEYIAKELEPRRKPAGIVAKIPSPILKKKDLEVNLQQLNINLRNPDQNPILEQFADIKGSENDMKKEKEKEEKTTIVKLGESGKAIFYKTSSLYLEGKGNTCLENLAGNLWPGDVDELCNVVMVRSLETLSEQLTPKSDEPDQMVLFFCMDGADGSIYFKDPCIGTINDQTNVCDIVNKIDGSVKNKVVFMLFSMYRENCSEQRDDQTFERHMEDVDNYLKVSQQNGNKIVVVYSEKECFDRDQVNWLLTVMLNSSKELSVAEDEPLDAFLKRLDCELLNLAEDPNIMRLKKFSNIKS